MIGFDITSINAVEGNFIQQIQFHFDAVITYAKHLLYYFLSFEIIACGLCIALLQHYPLEQLLFKLIKVGLILFLLDNYILILDSIINSLLTFSDHRVENILLNPGLIWQYGYNFCIDLLHQGSTAEGFGPPLLFISLGLCILFTIAIFSIQIFLQVTAYYLLAMLGALLIPLSVFTPCKSFFSVSIQNLLQAAIRIMVQSFIVIAALDTWESMQLQHFNPDMTIDTPIAFLFTGLLFVIASAVLPGRAVKMIPKLDLSMNLPSVASAQTTVNSTTQMPHLAAPTLATAIPSLPSMSTTITPNSSQIVAIKSEYQKIALHPMTPKTNSTTRITRIKPAQEKFKKHNNPKVL